MLEDDIEFNRAWPDLESEALETLSRQAWDIVNLGYLDEMDAPIQEDHFGWLRFSDEVIGSHAYLVNGPFLSRWIEHLETIANGVPGDNLRGPMSPDGAINTITWVSPETKRYLANPCLIGQRPSRSDVNTKLVDRIPVARWAVARLRAKRNRIPSEPRS